MLHLTADVAPPAHRLAAYTAASDKVLGLLETYLDLDPWLRAMTFTRVVYQGTTLVVQGDLRQTEGREWHIEVRAEFDKTPEGLVPASFIATLISPRTVVELSANRYLLRGTEESAGTVETVNGSRFQRIAAVIAGRAALWHMTRR